jgi:hypothetical protein
VDRGRRENVVCPCLKVLAAVHRRGLVVVVDLADLGSAYIGPMFM